MTLVTHSTLRVGPTSHMRKTALAAAVLSLVLLLGACSTTSRKTTIEPPRTGSNAGLVADMASIKSDYAALQREQQATRDDLAELKRAIEANREDQTRFREMMTTNFDLLEQSVALTLAKGITADLPPLREATVQPLPAPQKPTAVSQTAPPRPTSTSDTSAMSQAAARPAAAPQARNTPRATATPTAAPAPAAQGASTSSGLSRVMAAATGAVAARSTAAGPAPRSQVISGLGDPDLEPPANPRQLTAHPTAKRLYEKGFGLFARKEFDQSIIVFENFLNRYPDDIYSDNAQFWIGEANTRLDRDEEADKAYRAVLRNYEHRSTLEGYKTPDAIYRLGQRAQQRSDGQAARYYYQALVDRFPDTSAGRKANRALAGLQLSTAQN